MKQNYYFILLLTIGMLSGPTVKAQQIEKIKTQINAANGTPAFIEFNPKSNLYRLEQADQALKLHLNLNPEDELKKFKEETDNLGFTHQRYNQFYKGVKVEHGSYIVHAKGGILNTMNGEIKKIENLVVNPSLSESAALRKALSFVNAKSYMWQVPAQEATFLPKGELVIVENHLATEKEKSMQPVLAYKFDIYAQQPLSRDYIYVDAHSGEVVFKDAIIKHATATGTAATRYSGSRSITTDSYSGSYRLREYTRGNGIETYNCQTGTSYTAAIDFTDNDNSWTSAEHNNTAKDNAALDAHWAAQMTYDYFKQKHNRNSFDNNGAAIKSYVHYDKDYENAFWNGSVMTYGDGATRFDALTSLDVGAHEIGHAVCSHSANLKYSNESGAMNEGFSDIWGAAVEQFAAPEKSIWLIGEDIDKQRPSLRSMSDPNVEKQPDTYKGDYWYTGTGDNGGVHTNSGVLNHWFYILSVGKTGTNDIGTAYDVAGIGITDAALIAYRTETVYLTSSSVYSDARTYSIKTAVDLFGAGSNQEIQTTNAWNAVGIGGKYGEITYCASQGNNSSYEWVAKVELGSFVKESGAAGYSDFTGTTVSVSAGSSYTLTLTPGFASTTYNEYWKTWIDYNKDGDFDDTGELVFDAGALSKTAVSGTVTIPSTASGNTRMRVSMKYNGAQTSCETFSYGEVEDYTISISGSTTCATPGSLASSNITSSGANLSWGAVSGASSYDVRYKPTSATSWTTTSTTETSLSVSSLTASTEYEFQVRTVCSGSTSAFSGSATFTTAAATVSYCASNGKNASYEWIDLVQYGGINQSSGSDGGYKDNTGLTANVTRGASTTIYFSAGFSGSSYTEYWRVWIDFNQDGDFADSGEQLVSGSSSSSGTLSSTFTIPSTALLGKTRMRVSMKYGSAPGPCESFSYGEVEDYSVNIGSSLSAGIAAFGQPAAEELGNETNSDFVIFPNPATDFINFRVNNNTTTVKILTLTGAEVKKAALVDGSQPLDISSLVPGVYILSINDGQKQFHQRLIKQ
jgi:bacillolysin